MPTTAPQHLRPRARPRLTHNVTLRRGTLLATGAAVAVPASAGAVFTAPSALAAPIAPQAAPSPGVQALPATPNAVVVLRYGSTGASVRSLQSRLAIAVDGNFGPRTLTAVKAFQSRKGLTVDGVVGPLTWSALGGYLGPTPTDPTPPTPQPGGCTKSVLRYGAAGTLVTVLQGKLGISADGDFGPGTLSAVRAYQSRKGLSVDGVVGPATWASLGGYPCSTPTTPPPTDPTPPPPSSGTTGQDVLNIAKKYLGLPYVYGAESPSEGFDCSGLTQYVYRQVGVLLPRSSRAQSEFRPGVSLTDLRVGDLLFFHSPISHVAFYAGNGQILDASKPGQPISIHKMWVQPVKAIRLV